MLGILVFITGFCSMMYEVALAQLLSGLLGNTFLRYATTIGIYVTAMGVGSIVFRSTTPTKERAQFFGAEVCLAVIGLIAPILFIVCYYVAQKTGAGEGVVLLITHATIALVGFFSGFELPILSSLAEKRMAGSSSKVLAIDYFGMFVAAVAFPILLFPRLGIFPVFYLVTLLNLCAAGATLFLRVDESKTNAKALSLISVLIIVNLALIFWSSGLTEALSRIYARST